MIRIADVAQQIAEQAGPQHREPMPVLYCLTELLEVSSVPSYRLIRELVIAVRHDERMRVLAETSNADDQRDKQ